jgi:hypothetical protein
MNILVACEESQAVTIELRLLGHNAFSCDLLPCSGGHPEWHFKIDVFEAIENKGGTLQNGNDVKIENWDMMIANPPSNYLELGGEQWYFHPADKHLPVAQRRPHPKYPNRAANRDAAFKFFIDLANAPIQKIALENTVGIISSRYRKPDQIVQPFMFGDEATKKTCLWLKNLPTLEPTNLVGEGERIHFKSGKSQSKWSYDLLSRSKSNEERTIMKSKTFMGMAKAMAEQWTN